MKEYRQRFEHHLLLKMAGPGVAEAEQYLKSYFAQAEGDFFVCTPEEARKRSCTALPQRAPPCAITRYMPIRSEDILALDIALRRNDTEWFETLPPEIDNQLVHKLYYGHFMCHVFHQDYVVKKGADSHALKEQMLAILNQRGAGVSGRAQRRPSVSCQGRICRRSIRMPIPPTVFNPGIGKTSKQKHWGNNIQ
ncbi:D-lactate dehydrogenase [Serratia fonticola]|uniref:D-lactate dehydrogenase n=1 Tax=Serratia fonticola TaxID=47917 RepID=A0A4U9VY19_SERFO|nr:D-lactate dehydrogenase [Serratia fonticola]